MLVLWDCVALSSNTQSEVTDTKIVRSTANDKHGVLDQIIRPLLPDCNLNPFSVLFIVLHLLGYFNYILQPNNQ